MMNIIGNAIPVSLFDQGYAEQIFEEVKRSGKKVVMKNNTAECVLLAPEEYELLVDEVNDARLMVLASERLRNESEKHLLSLEEACRELGIVQDDIRWDNEASEFA